MNNENLDGNPQITVLMTVYSSDRFLAEAIESILNQTFQSYEFLIVIEAGAKESVVNIVTHYMQIDSRIRTVTNKTRLGLAESLNVGIREAKGKYIARMDDDDISLPERFQKQYELMEREPKLGLCGTLQTTITPEKENVLYVAVDSEELKGEMLFGCQLSHTSVMIRRELFMKNKWYYPNDRIAEDYSLWLRILDKTRMVNISEPLVRHRYGFGNISFEKGESLIQENVENIKMALELYLDVDCEKWHRELFYSWRNSFPIKSPEHRLMLLREGEEFVLYLISQNNKVGFVQLDIWERILTKRYQWLLKRLNIFELYLCGKMQGGLKNLMVKPDSIVIRDGSRLIIYGIGKRFEDFFKHYPMAEFRNRYRLIGCTDSKGLKSDDSDIDFIPIVQLKNRQFDYILISTSKYYSEIKNNLLAIGISDQKIGLLVQCYL